LLERFGRMKFADVLHPAIEYAEQGFPVSELIANAWASLQPKLDMNPSAARAYLHRDQAPRVGEIHKQPDLAKTLRALAEGGRDVFYRGEIADKIAQHASDTGGLITRADLANHTSTWDEPISTTYHDVTLYECPPNGQGIVALETLNLLENFDLRALEHNSAEYLHLLIEAMKLAFADAFAHVADPRVVPVPTAQLLDKAYAAKRRTLIDMAHALEMPP